MKVAELAARVGLSETQTSDLLRVVNLVPDEGEILEPLGCQTFIDMAERQSDVNGDHPVVRPAENGSRPLASSA